MDRRLTVVEAAEYLNVDPTTLQYWRTHRVGPAWYKLGKRVMYDLVDLDAYVAQRKMAAAS